MKVQLRRFVTIGLMSGSLAASIVAGSAAVGAATPNGAPDPAAGSGLSLNRSHEVRGDVDVTVALVAPVTTDRVVVIVPATVVTPTTPVQVFNRDART